MKTLNQISMCSGCKFRKLSAFFKPWVVKYPPDTVFLMVMCVLSGVKQLGSPGESLSNMPIWISVVWSLVLALGSLTALIGIFWPVLPIGFLIEGAGRTMLWPTSIAYSVVLYQYNPSRLAAALVFAFGIVCLIRALYVRQVYAEWQGLMENGARNN